MSDAYCRGGLALAVVVKNGRHMIIPLKNINAVYQIMTIRTRSFFSGSYNPNHMKTELESCTSAKK